ncbi:hypothetical protein PAMP_015966 [Pampus punctatissimus]
MTTICDDITTESWGLSDEAAKVVYQMKRASSVSSNIYSNTTESQKKSTRKKKAPMEGMMSLFGSFLSDEQFQCSICLDVFTNPSSTPCGHSFCMTCISRYWDGSKVCQCPLCKKTFQKRPDLQINRTLREITEQFKSMTGGQEVGREKRGGKGGGRDGGIPNDLFDELRKKLPRPLPNIPVMLSYEAQTQSEPVPTSLASSLPSHSPILAFDHNFRPPPPPSRFSSSSSRRRFTVSGAASSKNLPLCDIHQRGIMVYCKTDKVCICPECVTEDHPDHDTVTIEAKWMETKLAVERELAGSVCMFSALACAIERSQAELLEVLEMNRKAAEHQADATIRQLELEVEELQRRESALVQLAQSDDHIHCVKTFPILPRPPPAKDWSGVSVNSDLGTGTIYRSLAAQVERFQEDLKSIAETGFPASSLDPSPVRTQPMDVTLDSNTAHPRLILSEDMKSVRCADRHQLLPDNTERFDRVVCVLGREAISSGRHYWEVQVGGKTDWDLGVAKQSINRKGKIEVTPSNGYWFLSLRDKNKYAFRTEPSTDVHLNLRPHKIGIFVDFEKGQVQYMKNTFNIPPP